MNNKELVDRINKMAALIEESKFMRSDINVKVDKTLYVSTMADVEHRIKRAYNSYMVQDFLGNTENAAYWLSQEIESRMIKIKKDHCGK